MKIRHFVLYTSRPKTIPLWLSLVLLFLVPISGICTDADGSYVNLGIGTNSCGTFVEARRNGHNLAYMDWLGGYLTAINMKTMDTYNILGTTDIRGAMLWIENYCHKYPLETFDKAALRLSFELYPKRTTKAPK